MRLTEYIGKNYKYSTAEYICKKVGETSECMQKLGQLEDIEEEVGIDLLTLFKALKNGVYFKDDKEHHVITLDVVSSGNYRLSYQIIDDLFKGVYVKGYGKTWALTKEELENGKEEN